MNDESAHKDAHSKSWLERLSHAMMREPQDREDLVTLLRDAEERHLLDADALTMIEGVLQVSEMQVRDIMVPRGQMTVVEEDQHFKDFLPAIIASSHSRFPVIGEDRDEVLGILLAKDLLRFCHDTAHQEKFHIKEITRPAVFVPESKRLDVLLKEFRQNRNHMAIVVDEYGGVAGLVTIEDVLEQIVGNIEDEYDIDDEEAFIQPHTPHRYTLKALTPIDAFNDYFNSDFSAEEFDTIGGIVLKHFGHFPKRGESIVVDKYCFEVLKADKRRIISLQMEVLGENSGAISYPS